ncbi:MAG: hypothetical protein HOV80_34945 [Polyangiaceae bacterium]|nr:hypothetical protein [Polyangiaceae bacterium]
MVVLAAGGAIAVAFGVHRAKAAALVRWNEWRMAVSSNALRITGWGPAMELTRAQVTGITRLPGRGIVVEGATQLTLPEHIEGVEEVEQHLRRWMDGEPPPAPDVLRSELDQLREAAPYAASNVRGRFGTRFVVFALVCAVAFLAIWQFLDSSR